MLRYHHIPAHSSAMGNFLLTFAGDADGGGADGGDCHGVMVVMVEVLLMVVMVVLMC